VIKFAAIQLHKQEIGIKDNDMHNKFQIPPN